MQPSPPPTFGRRTTAASVPAARVDAQPLSDAAERFRSGLSAAASTPEGDFAAWRRSRGAGRAAAWLATFALLAPGVICLVAQVPTGVSLTVEAVGIAANWWLRRRRRAHLAAIRAWGEETA